MSNSNIRLRVLPKVPTIDGRSVELRVTDTYVQWRLVGDTEWIDLVPLSAITGPAGPAPEFRSDGVFIQYRTAGSGDPWMNLVALADITGEPGSPGAAATITVGDVTSLPYGDDPTFTNVGTPNAAIFDIGIPEGAPGAGLTDGDKGDIVVSGGGTAWAINKASQAQAENIATPSNAVFMTPQRSYQQAFILSDFVDVRALGGVAAAYGSSVDCTAAIQAFITANPNGPHIRFPRTASGTGFKVSQLALPSGTIISGEGQEQSNIWHFGSTSLFDVRGSFVTIRDLRIDAANTTSGASEVKLRTGLGGIERIRVENISTYYSRLVLWDDWSYLTAGNLAVAVELMNIKARYHQGPGFDMRDCWAYLRLRDIVVDYIGGASKNFAAYSLLNNAGSVWESCDVTGGTVDGTLPSNHAFVFQKSTAVWMNDCFADTVDGHGFYFVGQCSGFYMGKCGSSLVGNFPVAIGATGGGCADIELNGFQSFGRKGLGYAPASKPGIYAIGSQDISVIGGQAKNHTGDGLLFENCNYVVASGFRSRLNTGRGARTIGTGGALEFIGGIYSDNTAGVFAFTGAAHHGVNVVTTSGALGNLSGIGTL